MSRTLSADGEGEMKKSRHGNGKDENASPTSRPLTAIYCEAELQFLCFLKSTHRKVRLLAFLFLIDEIINGY